MHILITGAAGFVGQLLAKTLLDDEDGSYTIIMTDIVEPPIPAHVKWPQHAKALKADLCIGAQDVVLQNLDAAFVFHGVMSAGSEADFDLGKWPLAERLRAIPRNLLTHGSARHAGKFHRYEGASRNLA